MRPPARERDDCWLEIDGGAPDNRTDEERACDRWLANVPDFVQPAYPFDLPPYRIPFAQAVFTYAGAPTHCPNAACRRSARCKGGDGPPCFRADRTNLHQVLSLWWLLIEEIIDEDHYWDRLAALGNRYAAPEEAHHDRGQAAQPAR